MSLRNSSFGLEIDSHDVVIRMNQGAFAQLDSASTGLRTDYIFLTLTGGSASAKWRFLRKAMASATKSVVLMSSKGRSLFRVDLAPFFLHYPTAWHEELIERLGHRPSTGAMAVDFLLRTVKRPEQVELYGFDFFKTPDIAHGRNRVVAHDPQVEERYIRSVIDPTRLHLSPSEPERPIA